MLLRVNAGLLARAILILLCLSACGTAGAPSSQDDDSRRASQWGVGGGY